MADLVLVVDDEPVQRRLIEASLEKLGYRVLCADGGQAAIDALTDKSADAIKAVILDLVMPDIDGLSVLNAMQTHGLQQPVIVQTAQGGVETAVNAMRAGAVDFVVKPAAPARLKTAIQNALKLGALETTKKRKRKPAPGNGGVSVDEIISASPKMETVKQIVTRGAKSGIPVLIEGESGVGKEMIARAIHGMSKRASGPMITVNCGALPETLVESILFGHEKGAFTGAS
ncbi:MAG: sigma 54-interacting transcriptional regulator, partial [Pseudomonadota bacterium]